MSVSNSSVRVKQNPAWAETALKLLNNTCTNTAFLGLCLFFVKRLSEQPRPVPNLSQAAKAGQPEKAVVSTLKSQASESGSSDSSDSEEESPAAQRQPPQAGKSSGSRQNPSPASLWVSSSPLHMEQLPLWTAVESNSFSQ